MKKILLTGALALGIAAAPGARPAQAIEGMEAIGLILGLGALAAIGNELNDRDNHSRVVRHHHTTKKVYVQPRPRVIHKRPIIVKRAPAPVYRNPAHLPRHCVRATGRSHLTYGKNCLKRSGYGYAKRPKHRHGHGHAYGHYKPRHAYK